MFRLTIFPLAGMLASTVLLGAQATTQQPAADRPATATQPSEQRAGSSADPKVRQTTISGCLKPGTSADTFILTNAGTSSAAGAAAPAAQGTTGSTKSYAVVVKPGTDISKHVNHRIEVTGTVSASATGSKPSSTPASETSTVKAAQPTETFNVESFKMVAMACP